MNRLALRLYVTVQSLKQSLKKDEQGQDLIEYILIGGVVAFATIAGMQGLANNLNSAFQAIGSKTASYS
jgi:Flp pilus assembly pilin Flp